MNTPRKKHPLTRPGTTLIAFKADPELAQRLDSIVKARDTDRSKYLRGLLRKAVSEG